MPKTSEEIFPYCLQILFTCCTLNKSVLMYLPELARNNSNPTRSLAPLAPTVSCSSKSCRKVSCSESNSANRCHVALENVRTASGLTRTPSGGPRERTLHAVRNSIHSSDGFLALQWTSCVSRKRHRKTCGQCALCRVGGTRMYRHILGTLHVQR